MLTFFQKTVLGTIGLAAVLVALVLAAKAPAQATTISPVLPAPGGAVPAGIVTTGDAIVRVKPDAAVVGVGAVVQGSTADQATARAQAIGDARSKAEAMAKAAGVALGKVVSVSDIGLTPTVDTTTYSPLVKSAVPAAMAPQLPTGELQVTVRVQVQFEIGG